MADLFAAFLEDPVAVPLVVALIAGGFMWWLRGQVEHFRFYRGTAAAVPEAKPKRPVNLVLVGKGEPVLNEGHLYQATRAASQREGKP